MAQVLLSYSQATSWDFCSSLPPVLPLLVPVIGVLTLIAADLKVALDHSDTRNEMTVIPKPAPLIPRSLSWFFSRRGVFLALQV